jgi:hypothetical protein
MQHRYQRLLGLGINNQRRLIWQVKKATADAKVRMNLNVFVTSYCLFRANLEDNTHFFMLISQKWPVLFCKLSAIL